MIPVPPAVLEQFTCLLHIDPSALTYLGGGGESSDGIAYTFNSGEGARVLKILPFKLDDPLALATFRARVRFLHFCGEHGADVVYPLVWPDGALMAAVPTDENLFAAYLMEKAEGTHPEHPEADDTLIYRWGQMIGKMHAITQTYPDWEYSRDESTGARVLGWEQEVDSFTEWAQEEEIKAAWMKMRQTLAGLRRDRSCFGFIHNDPHQQNILVTPQRMVLLDFDVANYHWFMVDISITLQGLLFSQTGGVERPCTGAEPLHRFLKVFMQGYETENHLDPFWLEQIDVFIAYRRLLLYTVMQGWLATEPEKKAEWKRMILENPRVMN